MEICWTEKRFAHVYFYMTLCAKKMIVKELFAMKNTKAWEIICVCNYISNGPFASQCVGKNTSLYSDREFPKRKAKLEKMSAVLSVAQNGAVPFLLWCPHPEWGNLLH